MDFKRKSVMNQRAVRSNAVEIGRGLTGREIMACSIFMIIVAYLFGTFDRFPFDDEIVTLALIEHLTPIELLVTRIGLYDIHPPGSYLMFQLLYNIGLPLWAMRCVSLIMSAIAFLLILDLTLSAIRAEGSMVRFATIIIFLTFPLLYGVGDALRWYPLFAVLVAGFFWLELRRGQPTIVGGVLFGLSVSTNFLAFIPYFALAGQRYLLRRRFNSRVDGSFHLAAVIFAAPGLATFVCVLLEALHRDRSVIHLQFTWSVLASAVALAQMGIGFLGGYRIGPVEILLGLPIVALFVLALGRLALRRLRQQGSEEESRSAELTGDLLVITVIMTVLCIIYSLSTDFDQGRALLFLVPFVLASFALAYWRCFSAAAWLPVCLASLLLFGTALANARQSTAPFKRDLVIPFDEVRSFIADNVHGSVLFVTYESVIRYLMRDDGYCSMFSLKPGSWLDVEPELSPCARDGLDRFDTIVVGLWPPNGPPWTPSGSVALDYIHEHRKLHARARFGYDRWAGLKTRLTGRPLGPWIMTVEIYH
jgi:hypothetical protein